MFRFVSLCFASHTEVISYFTKRYFESIFGYDVESILYCFARTEVIVFWVRQSPAWPSHVVVLRDAHTATKQRY